MVRAEAYVVTASEEPLVAAARRLAEATDVYALWPTTATADEVTAARIALEDVFVEAGWTPSARDRERMERDRELLRHRVGHLDRDDDGGVPRPRELTYSQVSRPGVRRR